MDVSLPEKVMDALSKMTSREHQKVASDAGVGFWTVQSLAYRKQKSATYESLFRLGLVLFPRQVSKAGRLKAEIEGKPDAQLQARTEQQVRAAKAALSLIADGGIEIGEAMKIAADAIRRLETKRVD